MRRFGIAIGLICALCGCEDDLPKVTLISHMRVLGARTAVVGDEDRTTPRPGETARMTWTVAFTDVASSDEELSSLFLSCTAPERYTGNPVCQELIDLATGKRGTGFGFGAPAGCDTKPDSVQNVLGIQLVCVTGTPELDVKVPSNGKQPRLVQGIICRNGVPQFDLESPTGASCLKKDGVKDEDFESISVTGQVPLELKEDEQNHNPDLSKLEIRIAPEGGDLDDDNTIWKPVPTEDLPALAQDCLAGDVIKTSDGHVRVIDIRPENVPTEAGESLVFSTYATLGEMSRRFTVFDEELEQEGEESSDLTWTLSEEQRDDLFDAPPTLVRFFITVSDERGGFAVTTRELCVTRLSD
ncbi:MAG TPA: hypothetical protein VJR89_32760 [Polyangiales bacterium]|nr:hypothetical protein [Polyangiales bacterium]